MYLTQYKYKDIFTIYSYKDIFTIYIYDFHIRII